MHICICITVGTIRDNVSCTNPSSCNLTEIRKASCRVTVYAQGYRQEFKPGKTTKTLTACTNAAATAKLR